MALSVGTRLGPYEIIAPLGVGGMGEVYRARDTKLGRDVAIKIVSDGFGHDPERLARFQREAHLLAALNHPHIAAIYGLEESNGSQFLVLELVEGDTLAERLRGGPLPVSEALTIGRQIADALQAAHEKGIIHRDLKPANIAFTADGQVKVLDFGLAKTLEMEPVADGSNSPTMTLGGTQPGLILGTAAYMAPEQAKGRAADKRSDVWAFGCVLFEMLVGKRAFEGEDVSDTLAAVLRGEPNWGALPNDLPTAILTVIRRCLEKDRRQRIADISTAHFLLTEPIGIAPSTSTALPPPMWRRMAMPIGTAFAAAVVAGTAGWFAARIPTSPPSRVSRLQITPPIAAGLTINTAVGHDVAITPDGTRVVYTGSNGTLFVRALDRLDATPLTGLDAPGAPFVSPDGHWIGFAAGGNSLKKVAITGGPAIDLVRLDGTLTGATWGPDDAIVFATGNPATGLQRLAAGGDEPTALTQPDRAGGEGDHFSPEFLPGGQAVLFTIMTTTGGLDQAQIAVLDLRTGMKTTLIRGGSDAHYVPSGAPGAGAVPGAPAGYLLYGVGGTLRAVGFDLSRLAVVGTPVPVVPQVVTNNIGAVDVAVAGDGTLVYVPGAGTGVQHAPVWVDRQGQETPLAAAQPRGYAHSRISPDGTRVAFSMTDQEQGIWLWDLVRGALTRLTSDTPSDIYPVWTPDGRRLLFSSFSLGQSGIVAKAADGTGAVTPRLTSTGSPTSISPDGTRLVFTQNNVPNTGTDVMQLRMDGSHEITPLVQTRFTEQNGDVSPDGRWLAYEANESGLPEIYVRPFPDVAGGRWQVSTGGGRQPLWARSGQELFYLGPTGTLMRVGVARGATWDATAPARLFEAGGYYNGTAGQVGRNYDVAPDGRRFLMIKPGGGSESTLPPTSLVVVLHFDEELKRLVPTR